MAMSKLVSSIVHGFVGFTNKSLVKNLIVITICVIFVFVQIFFPFNYYASASRNPSSSFQVGIHYVYEQDNLDQIYGEVTRIHDLGFKAIRISLECNPLVYDDAVNQKTDKFFSATDNFGLAVALVIPNDDTAQKVNYYLDRWGSHLKYVQVMNEPESSSSWDVGALFTDNEIVSKFDNMYSLVQSHHLSVQLYTNFGIGFILRSNLPMEFSKKLDFVGLDIYMDSFLVLSPHFVQNMQGLTHNKDVVITEFGMSTSDGTAQSTFIIKGLNLFKSMGLKGCWLVYWNSEFDNYGIRGRPAEQAVGDWIAQNAK
jgi:hypothetical protein